MVTESLPAPCSFSVDKMAWGEAVPGFGGQSGTFSQCSPGPHSELVVWSTGKRVM